MPLDYTFKIEAKTNNNKKNWQTFRVTICETAITKRLPSAPVYYYTHNVGNQNVADVTTWFDGFGVNCALHASTPYVIEYGNGNSYNGNKIYLDGSYNLIIKTD